MAERLLEGIRVVDLAAAPTQMTGRILADLGAEGVKVEPPGGHPARADPPGYAHVGAAAAMAAPTALAAGRPQLVDAAGQEAVMAADMCAPATFVRTGARGTRRGANIGRSREIGACRDGFVSFGLRGGKARVPSLQTITRLATDAGMATPAPPQPAPTAVPPLTPTGQERP